MAMYFSYHISGDVGFWVVILYLVGLSLIMLDGKFITDGTVAVIGVLLMIAGLALPSPDMIYGFLVSMGFILGAAGSMMFLKVFPSRIIWSKMTLRDRLTGDKGYNSINESYRELIGKQGKTITPFRPTGTIVIEEKQYSATSGSQWIEANKDIEVVSVDGTRIVIREIEKSTTATD